MDIVTYALLNSKINSISPSPYSYKGAVDTQEDLPTGASIGDMYSVKDTGKSYVWDGTAWNEVSIEGGAWGSITGDIADQTDLITILESKQKKIYTAEPSNPQDGDIWIDEDDHSGDLIYLTANDINFDLSAAYQLGSIGKEIKAQEERIAELEAAVEALLNRS